MGYHRNRRRFIQVLSALLIITLAVMAIFLFQPRPLLRILADRQPRVLYYFDTEEKAVALTIDDGPTRELTPRILDILGEHGVAATFFVLGDNIRKHPDLVERMLAEEHEIGNHMMRDEPSIKLPPEEFATQLDEFAAIAGDADVRWYRPGSGWFNNSMLDRLEQRGLRCCLGSVYPQGPKFRHAGFVSWHVRSRVHPGAVIVLHEGRPDREYVLDVLTSVIPELKKQGYAFYTLTELDRKVSVR